MHKQKDEDYGSFWDKPIYELVLSDFDSLNSFSDKIAYVMVDDPETLLCLELLERLLNCIKESRSVAAVIANEMYEVNGFVYSMAGIPCYPHVKSHGSLESLQETSGR